MEHSLDSKTRRRTELGPHWGLCQAACPGHQLDRRALAPALREHLRRQGTLS